jgi:uncharacterized Ntn-hydrolase superfamily protein
VDFVHSSIIKLLAFSTIVYSLGAQEGLFYLHHGLFSCFGVKRMPSLSVGKNDAKKKRAPLVHTYSIVARDPVTRDMGVAVQSHWFSVGTVVTWGEAGVGAIATQAFANVSFGPRGLQLLRQGMDAKSALDSLIDSDEAREMRQLAILDAKGGIAAHTGKKCIPFAGHIVEADHSVQANMMINGKVWPAMDRAFRSVKGPLSERMLRALEAGEAAGGDIRGRQSAALLVVRGKSTGNSWEDRLVDLRVDDSAEPLVELRRLLAIHQAYEQMNQGDAALEKGKMAQARAHYSSAERLFPENEEMRFWHAVTLASNGLLEESLPLFKDVFRRNKNWRALAKRLVPTGQLLVDEAGLAHIVAQ